MTKRQDEHEPVPVEGGKQAARPPCTGARAAIGNAVADGEERDRGR